MLSQCLSCPAGYYCLSYNLFTPTGLCPSGYYCPSGSISGILCPPGAFCSIGAPEYSSCPSGTYQNNPGQSFCLTCPAGFFCPGGVIDYNSGAFDCPPGYYCLNGTRYSTEYPCPSGTFSNRSNALSLNDCTLAPGGYFVNGTGNFEVTGMCDSGYYCPLGALTATPHCNTTYCTSGGRCVPGQFCPNASAIFSPCPGGGSIVVGTTVRLQAHVQLDTTAHKGHTRAHQLSWWTQTTSQLETSVQLDIIVLRALLNPPRVLWAHFPLQVVPRRLTVMPALQDITVHLRVYRWKIKCPLSSVNFD